MRSLNLFKLPSGYRSKDFVLPLFWCGVTLVSAFLFYSFVDLKPKVEENFFFSSNDPELKADKEITKLFPQPPQIIISARGDLLSPDYQRRTAQLTDKLLTLPEVVEVQSLTRGPKNIPEALESPLWARALVAKDRKSSIISVLIKDVSIEKAVADIEKVKDSMSSTGNFDLEISGAPYIVEIIRRNLLRDFKVFSVAAFLVFAAMTYLLFRSLPILAGTLLACLNVSMLTLTISEMLNIQIGPLTSNLSVIVFVLALSHIVFITFSWKYVRGTTKKEYAASEAVKITIIPSVWSVVTEVLGFVSLFFVKAEPLQQLGISGLAGTLIAFAGAYLIYPSFLRLEALRSDKNLKPETEKIKKVAFFERTHRNIAIFLLALTAFIGLGILNLNSDPSLLAYFKKGSELRQGLEYIDQNGGSTPLKIVVALPNHAPMDTGDAYKKLWALHLALERDPSVGNVLSLPMIVAEAKENPIGSFLPINWLLNILEKPKYGDVVKYFITKDRKKVLILLRMNEMDRKEPRLVIVKRIEGIIRKTGFEPVLVGGVYFLQGRLSELIISSTVSGLVLLAFIFTGVGGFISRSIRVAFAILVSLLMIPLWTVGLIGHFHIPFDAISSPGTNIAIGLAVDSMINMLIFVKQHSKAVGDSGRVWSETCARFWEPILYTTILTCVGFGIFMLSVFPPTQRFGFSVILGTLVAPLAALVVFPWLAAGSRR